MTVVKINAITVPEGQGPELERRFATRNGVQDSPGFVSFELLRPVKGDDRYFVVTHWETEEAFQGWLNGNAFRNSHAQAAQPGGPERKPVSSHADLLEFEVVDFAALPASS